MVCWSYKKLCFVILLPYNVVLCCHVDISRGCLQVSIAPCLTVHTDRSVLNDNYTITKGDYDCSITAARKLFVIHSDGDTQKIVSYVFRTLAGNRDLKILHGMRRRTSMRFECLFLAKILKKFVTPTIIFYSCSLLAV